MGRAAPALSSFNSGELSPRIEGRVDTEKYASGAKKLENFVPLIQGPATRRGGTRFIQATKDSTARSWLMKFEFSTSQAYVLEVGNGYIRFFTNGGAVQIVGAPAYNGATTYTLGNVVISGGVNYYCIATTVGNAPPNATYWYAMTGSTYEIPSPYLTADLITTDLTFQLRTINSADVIYICHPLYQQRKLTRYGPTDWRFAALQSVGGPFKEQNLTATTVVSSAASGAVTLTASAALFQAGHVGSLFYMELEDLRATPPWESFSVLVRTTGANPLNLTCRSGNKNYICTTNQAVVAAAGEIRTGTDRPTHLHGSADDGRGVAQTNGPERVGVTWSFNGLNYGAVLITGFTDTTHVTGTVVAMRSGLDAKLPAGVVSSSTTRWAFGDWSTVEGWPSHADFYRERLVFGRGQEIWMSTAADFENFNTRDDNGLVVADASIKLRLPTSQLNNLAWMRVLSPTVEALMVGTVGEEFAIKSQTENQPFGPDNVTAQPLSSIGSRNCVPVKVGNALLYVQRLGNKLRDLVYDAYGGYGGSNDQTLYAEHIPRPKLDQLAYAQDPNSVIWAVRSDGQLVAMTYSREQYANPPHGGWHRHPMTNGFVECIVTIPSSTYTQLWMIVNRTISGATKRYVELLTDEFPDTGAIADAFFVDCGLTYSGAPATVMAGLSHLEGQTVNILADGAVRPSAVVASGTITLTTAASKVQIGLPLMARLQTMRLNAGGQDGTSQGKKSRIPQAVIRLLNTVGLRYGADFDDAARPLDVMDFRAATMAIDTAIPPFTGDKEINWPGGLDGYNTNPWLCFEAAEPLPCTIIAVFPQSIVSDKG